MILRDFAECLEDIGEGGVMDTPRDPEVYPSTGRSTTWQTDNDPVCVSIYEETRAIHGADVDTRIGKLLEELAELHSC